MNAHVYSYVMKNEVEQKKVVTDGVNFCPVHE
jgi:hypothetical protein